jgi:hypothetical protein
MNGTTASGLALQLFDGTNTVGTAFVSQGSTDKIGAMTPVCGIYPVTSTSPVTLRLQGYFGTTTGVSGVINNNGSADIEWSIVQLSPNMNVPLLVGSVTSNTSGQERVERVSFGQGGITPCTSSPCTVVSQSGSWVSGVSRVSTGQYIVSIPSGLFSAPPICTCSSGAYGNARSNVCDAGTTTTNSLTTEVFLPTTQSFQDGFVNLICMGPR